MKKFEGGCIDLGLVFLQFYSFTTVEKAFMVVNQLKSLMCFCLELNRVPLV